MKVLVIGEIMVDEYLHCKCKKLSPEAPVPCVEVREVVNQPGGAANVVNNLVAFSCGEVNIDVFSVCNFGTIRTLIENSQVALFGKNSPSCLYRTRYVDINSGMHMLRVDNDREIDDNFRILGEGTEICELLDRDYDCIIISDYNHGLVSEKLMKHVKELAKCPVLVDSRNPDLSRFVGVDALFLNRQEATAYVGQANKPTQTALKIMDELGPGVFIHKLDKDGFVVFTKEKNSYVTAVASGKVIDPTGAGDAMLAAYSIMEYHVKANKENTLIAMAHVAGDVCTQKGTLPTSLTYEDFLDTKIDTYIASIKELDSKA